MIDNLIDMLWKLYPPMILIDSVDGFIYLRKKSWEQSEHNVEATCDCLCICHVGCSEGT